MDKKERKKELNVELEMALNPFLAMFSSKASLLI